jgi:hypothetical protein
MPEIYEERDYPNFTFRCADSRHLGVISQGCRVDRHFCHTRDDSQVTFAITIITDIIDDRAAIYIGLLSCTVIRKMFP